MNWRRAIDLIFPYIEKLTPAETDEERQRYERDIAVITAAKFATNEEKALDEAHRFSATEAERVRSAEGKATTYLAVLAALVPLIITLQAANWEKKAGPAPDAARLAVLALATVYVAAAGFHAFKALQVQGFQRVGEAEIAAAWKTPNPLGKLARGTLLATRRSRDAVNAKITRIRVTHEHLLRAFGTFVLLLLLDPLFYAMGFRNAVQEPARPRVVVVQHDRQPGTPAPSTASTATSKASPAYPAPLPRPADGLTKTKQEAPAPEKAAPVATTSECTEGDGECLRQR